MKINVGGVAPGEVVTVSIKMIRNVEIEGGAYCLRLPLTYFPRFNPIKVDGAESEGVSSSPSLQTEYSISVSLHTAEPLTYLSCPTHT